jgi:hypothetical protein
LPQISNFETYRDTVFQGTEGYIVSFACQQSLLFKTEEVSPEPDAMMQEKLNVPKKIPIIPLVMMIFFFQPT